MPIIIAKEAGYPLTKEIIKRDFFIGQSPYFINTAYIFKGGIAYQKSSGMTDHSWRSVELLTPFPALIYINDSEAILKNREKKYVPPIIIQGKIAVISAGTVLSLSEETRKTKTDLAVLIERAIEPAMKAIPDLLFSEEGKWIINNLIPARSAIVALNQRGKFAFFNWEIGLLGNGYWGFDSVLASMGRPPNGKQLLLTNGK